jgi:hypothetical protein
MSKKYPGGVLSKTAPVPSGRYESSTASGIWSMEDVAKFKLQGTWPTAGLLPNYIEDVFSTYLYSGIATPRVIPNDIDITGKGGLVWIKSRSGAIGHRLVDTARGIYNQLESNSTAAQSANLVGLIGFNNNGFTVSTDSAYNGSSTTYTSWTFRKQPKFFDMVTYTGDGTSFRVIAHNLQSTPGALIIKATSTTGDWFAWCRTSTSGSYLKLNSSAAQVATGTPVSSSGFFVGTSVADMNTNQSGVTYVAYLFAHNAGGFGLTDTDNVISCGSFTTDGSSNASVTLGYEPQFVLVKSSSHDQNWLIIDNMRGWPSAASMTGLFSLSPNTNTQETSYGGGGASGPTATGFNFFEPNGAGAKTYIYIAIRRPMKVPTSGSTVLFPTTISAIGASDWSAAPLSQKSVDCLIGSTRTNSPNSGFIFTDRLRGLNGSYATSTSANLNSSSTSAESTSSYPLQLGDTGGTIGTNRDSPNSITYLLKRAPGFFDVVCYTGTGSARTVAHNLGAVPQLMIVKTRSVSANWAVYASVVGNTSYGILNSANEFTTGSGFWNNTTPTASVFTVGDNVSTNSSGVTYVAYLAATVPGVSAVGSYTGTGSGSTVSVDCGFTSGARFVMIKVINNSFNEGQWYVWDSARGISSGNDPIIYLNQSVAEVTGTNYVDTTSSGFVVNTGSPGGLNESGGTYLFWAIA